VKKAIKLVKKIDGLMTKALDHDSRFIPKSKELRNHTLSWAKMKSNEYDGLAARFQTNTLSQTIIQHLSCISNGGCKKVKACT